MSRYGVIGLHGGAAVRRVLPAPVALAITARANWVFGEPELPLLTRLCGPHMLALDVGANFGAYTYWLAKHSQRCIAFEPNPTCAAFLQRAHIGKLTVERVALSGVTGTGSLVVPRVGLTDVATEGRVIVRGESQSSVSRSMRRPNKEIGVALQRLDAYHLSNVGVIKIDTEGHESNVLFGGLETIRRTRPYILVECEERHRAGALAGVLAILTAEGYASFCISESRLRRFTSAAEGYRMADGVNFLFVPQERCVLVLPASGADDEGDSGDNHGSGGTG